MIVVIKPGTSRDQIDQVIAEVQKLGYDPRPIFGTEQTVIAAIGDERTHHTLESLNAMPQVEKVMPVQKRHKLVSRESHPANTVVNVDGVPVGGMQFALMAGPCSVESEEQLLSTAHAVKAAGASILRGGAYKPRTSPYEFQGLGKEGLRLLALAKEQTGLKIITEILSEVHVEHVAEVADILQVGARNAQNFQLLIACAKSGKPVLLKRGLSERIDEWLLAAGVPSRSWKWERSLLRKGHPHFRDVYPQHTRSGRRRYREKGIASSSNHRSEPGVRAGLILCARCAKAQSPWGLMASSSRCIPTRPKP